MSETATAWEDLGPTQALVAQQRRPSTSSRALSAQRQLEIAAAKLAPASSCEIVEALTPCLILVAPTGMTQTDREDWLSAAGLTIAENRVPVDLLKTACAAVRKTPGIDHPAKIVGAILDDVRTSLRWRRDNLRDAEEAVIGAERRIEAKRCSPEDAAAIRKEFGLGSAFATEPTAELKPLPTIEDYMAIGLTRAEAESVLAQQNKALKKNHISTHHTAGEG